MIGIARAHTNIALIKYWGKRDEQLFLPMNSSLSLTLDAFYTDTKIVFDPTLSKDEFYLNLQKEDATSVTRFLNLFRQQMKIPLFARVDSLNFVPTAAGLASSASAFAALAGAVNQASQLHLDTQTLSTFARQGSGSATRSLYGGFVEWDKGTNSTNSIAKFIDDASWDIGMVIIAINTEKKAVSSRSGMQHTVQTSPFYTSWVESSATDLDKMKQAIIRKDFKTLGELTEFNGMKMHATTLSANPPFTYFAPESITAINCVQQLRQIGFSAYLTMDAGPNVKILCRASDMLAIKQQLQRTFPADAIITSLPGKQMTLLTQSDWEKSIKQFKVSHYAK